MKVAIYSAKGGVGKTPLAIQFIKDKQFAVGSNESYDIYSGYLDDDMSLFVKSEEEFPAIPDHIDIVFDCAGTMSTFDYALVNAISQSDVVLIPVTKDRGAVAAAEKSALACAEIGTKVIFVLTELTKGKRPAGQDWHESTDFKTIEASLLALSSKLDYSPAVLPLRYCERFGNCIDTFKSIKELSDENGLNKYHLQKVREQIENIYLEVEKYV